MIINHSITIFRLFNCLSKEIFCKTTATNITKVIVIGFYSTVLYVIHIETCVTLFNSVTRFYRCLFVNNTAISHSAINGVAVLQASF